MTRGDLAVIALLAAGVGLVYPALWLPPEPASHFEVRIGGELVRREALAPARELTVEGARGASLLRSDGARVRFIDSPCRNRICVHSGWLEHAGEIAACLPNRVSVTLVGGGEALDAVSF